MWAEPFSNHSLSSKVRRFSSLATYTAASSLRCRFKTDHRRASLTFGNIQLWDGIILHFSKIIGESPAISVAKAFESQLQDLKWHFNHDNQ